MHCSDNWKKSENSAIEMSDLHIWKTNLFHVNTGALIVSFKIHRTNDQFNFFMKGNYLLNQNMHFISFSISFSFCHLLYFFLPPFQI